jgi:predicted ATPase/class 3 adenylate cyclase
VAAEASAKRKLSKNRARPSGAIAFLFSDIEGSTRRWDAYGDAMRDALRRHDEILQAEIERRRGFVFKTIGDAFCAAFWSVPEALAAAVDAQRSLGKQDFHAVDGLRVRMAISAGEADERAGDYFGTEVNRAARLLSTGHGGQILVSGGAADLLTGNLPSGITLRHLGTLALRDLKEPERVYQPIAAGLRVEFKALRALETPPNNLPLQTTTFVGRGEDVIRIERLLETERLITIVGVGGMGKTRLALEAASAALNDRKDGTWLVDFASLSDEALVVSTLLALLGADQTKDATIDALLEYLKDRELLLVMDNCEHLIGEVARTVAAVIARCRYVTILATSREALDVTGEYLYRLSTLDLEVAIRLFNDRARAADREFSPENEAQLVEEICRRLDGIALAIELAAARVRTIPVRKLCEHLELRLLAGGRDRQPRQQTMRALIDWSYDLLSPEERAYFRRCAAFIGGFTFESAIALGDAGDGGTLELLSSLVGKSLAVVEAHETGPRYRLLEPIRQYAREKLEENGETRDALRQHARAYASLAHDGYGEWDTNPQSDWLARLSKELPNFRAALNWTVGEDHDSALGAAMTGDVAPVFLRLTLLKEGIERCEEALCAEHELPTAAEARLRYVLSMLYQNKGAISEGFEQAVSAVLLYRRAGDSRGLARALSQLAHRHYLLARDDEAKAAAVEALALARELGDRRLLADALRRCAPAFARDGTDRMRVTYAESVALFRSLGHGDETARVLQWWGISEARVGNYSVAAERLVEAKELAGEELAVALAGDIAACYLVTGDRANAGPMTREALELAVKLAHPIHVPFAISYVAALAGERNATDAAVLSGYAEERLRGAAYQRTSYDRAIVEELQDALRAQLSDDELSHLFAAGAALSEEEAIARATALANLT